MTQFTESIAEDAALAWLEGPEGRRDVLTDGCPAGGPARLPQPIFDLAPAAIEDKKEGK